MGLGGLVVMSDTEATAIRGHGWKGGPRVASMVGVGGNSFATFAYPPIVNSHSEDSYAAEGGHKASGGSYSEAGIQLSGIGLGGLGGLIGNGPAALGRDGGHKGGMGGGGAGGAARITIKVFAGGRSWAHAH
jgi:hypothetical protein